MTERDFFKTYTVKSQNSLISELIQISSVLVE